jgi:NTE family protein
MDSAQGLRIRAYAIFDGGGVLGAALAGSLKAAEDQGIKFVGFGGTSAGSIIATLGAVGMSGEAIERAIVDTPFLAFLEDGGRPVARLRRRVDRLGASLGGMRWYNCPWKAFHGARHSWATSRMLKRPLGVDPGKQLRRKLHELIAQRHPKWNPNDKPDITFGMLHQTDGCYPLKVVASDVTKRKPVEFSLAADDYGNSVLNAVRASSCYPFVFEPFEHQGRRLVDGGLSSNLPASLFHDEQRQTGYPVFAFDLVSKEEDPPTSYSMATYLQDMMSTAIDAGDEFLRNVLDGVYHVPIPIPREFDVLDFEISRARREQLFAIGYNETTKYLSRQPVLKYFAMQPGDAVQRALQIQYGEPALYEPVLAAIARDIEEVSAARNVRVTLMLPTGRGTRIVVYSHGMVRLRDDGTFSYDADYDLEIAEKAGASGQAWDSGLPKVADLNEFRRDPARWGMTAQQASKLPADRQAMLSFPIPRLDLPEDPGKGALPERYVGTLTLDSSVALANTRWMEPDRATVAPRIAQRIGPWLSVVQRLLLFDQ